jgi:molecular chaperone GrpE
MSNQTHDPQAPGHGTGAPEPESKTPAGSAAQRDAAAAEYGRHASEAAQAAEQAPGETSAPSPVQALQAENADLKDQVLRAYAEMDNIRKRAERERIDTQKYAVSKFARDMLSVADNLERALAAVPTETADPILKGLIDGLSVTERGLAGVLERYGIKRISAEGATFDPHQHQAVMEHQDPSVPNGTVVRVFEAGYMIEDRVLRPASVVVAKGGPKPEKAATSQGAEATGSGASVPEAGNDNVANGGAGEPSAGA